MAQPDDRTPEQDHDARVADTRRAMELGLPPARGTTAGNGRTAGVRAIDESGEGRSFDPSEGRAAGDATVDLGERRAAGDATVDSDEGRRGGGDGAGGGGAAAGGGASGAVAAGPPIGEAAEQAKESVERIKAELESFHTAEAIWQASETSSPEPSQGSQPDHRRRSAGRRPPGQQSDRSGPGNRGPSR